jgi:hypothetical protein
VTEFSQRAWRLDEVLCFSSVAHGGENHVGGMGNLAALRKGQGFSIL